MAVRIAYAVDKLGHILNIPGRWQFYLCRWYGREVMRCR